MLFFTNAAKQAQTPRKIGNLKAQQKMSSVDDVWKQEFKLLTWYNNIGGWVEGRKISAVLPPLKSNHRGSFWRLGKMVIEGQVLSGNSLFTTFDFG